MPCWVTVLLKIIPPEFIVLLNSYFSITGTIRTRVDQPVGGFTCWVPVSVFLVNELTNLLAEFPFQSSLTEKCLLTAYFSCQLSRCLAECPFQHAKRIFLYSCLAEFPFQSRSLREVLANNIFQLLECYVLLNTRFSSHNALFSLLGQF